MLKKPNNILFLIVVLGLFLRLVGINHGFPFIFHPDEPVIVRSALGLRFNPNPGHFDWPHLYIYVNYSIYMVFAFIRDFLVRVDLKEAASSVFPLLWNDSLIFYLITRILSAILGGLTVIPIYLIGKKLFNAKVGILAAFAYATFPFQVFHSHYTMPDTPMVFLLSWAIYYGVKILSEKDYVNYVLAGFFFGLSASTKYNGILGAFIIPLAHFLAPAYSKSVNDMSERKISLFNSLMLFIAAGLSSILGFVMGTPYAALDYKTFLRTDGPSGALWQFSNVGTINIFQNFGELFQTIVYRVGNTVSYIPLVGLAFSVLLLIYRFIGRKFDKYDLGLSLMVIPTIILLFFVASHEKTPSHYFFVVYPYLAVIFGYFVSWIFGIIRKKSVLLSFISLAILIFLPLYSSFIVALKYYNNDTRLDLYGWGKTHILYNERILYDLPDFKDVLAGVTKNYRNVSRILPGEVYDYYVTGSATKLGGTYSEIYSVDNRFRLGPSIIVYKITK